jgi:ATP-dependent Lon protease
MSLPQGLLPILSLRNTVIFPGLTQVLKVGRERSVKALKVAEKNGFWIVAVQQKIKPETSEASLQTSKDSPVEPEDLYQTGTLCRIESSKGTAESGFHVVLKGMARIHLEEISVSKDNYLIGESTIIEDLHDMNVFTEKALLKSTKDLSQEILKLVPGNTEPVSELIAGVDDLSYLTALCIGNIDIDLSVKQKILEMRSLKDRGLYVLQVLQEFKESLSVHAEIRSRMNQKLGQSQRQIILREQLKAIREELGEGDDSSVEEKLQAKIDKAKMPEDVRKIAQQELKRLSEVGNQSPETHIIRNYLELLTSLPWDQSAPEKEIDLEEARRILDEDHFGLEKVKKRIIQHLAVHKLKALDKTQSGASKKGSLLLFVGPPGVGKTSLGQSIAKALGRKFARVSFGGVRDDSEVRGHRRTYIGAMPGRIIQGLKRVEENNPVFLLDEIDKLARAYNGDPAAALLEVLDPEQNQTFLDHYLDVPFDLSKVTFIATANSLESIPGPLLDRMEIIDLSGYTSTEKFHIAKNHLVPKQMKEHGLALDQIVISDETLMSLITGYTREAGVRDLQRKIANVLRGSSEKVIQAKALPVRVQSKDLEEILGPEKFQYELANTLNPPGVVTGLAWTPVGGDILFIESTMMPGKGDLQITGQLGDVMKESAKIALSLVRANRSKMGLTLDLEKTDLHVHVPAGAVPKDGPSAGVTLLTSLVSLISNYRVSPKLAMTGEITLRGAVTPVGGIKEKVIAAHRAGVETILIPAKNAKDLKEIPEDVRASLKFHFIDNISQLFEIALGLKLDPEKMNQLEENNQSSVAL